MCATIIKGMAFQKATEIFIVQVEGKKEKYFALQSRERHILSVYIKGNENSTLKMMKKKQNLQRKHSLHSH